ncbi:MAG: hypothetical protein KDK55_03225 [Chlamydiia bacterium]|nr:hypothetical protein [Chlamydiia bacterium]
MSKFIEIRKKLAPFSHLAGTRVLIPGTTYCAHIFPTLVRLFNLMSEKLELIEEKEIPRKGPVIPFTVMQDLEKQEVQIYGREKTGNFFKERLQFVKQKRSNEILFLGRNKKQEWEKIKQRGDLSEIFPIWFRLAALLPNVDEPSSEEGIYSLLKACQEVIVKKEHDKIFASFYPLFLAGFEGMMVPRLVDADHQGIITGEASGSPLSLLQASGKVIRSLFVCQGSSSISILPHLPPECESGRMIHLDFPFGELNFEWTKKEVRRVIFHSRFEGELRFIFPPKIKSFRLRTSLKERGKRIFITNRLELNSHSTYLLDQFQK